MASTLPTTDASWTIIESSGRADSPLLGFAPQGSGASTDPLHFPSPNYVRQLPEELVLGPKRTHPSESFPLLPPSPASDSEGGENDSDCPSPLRRNCHGTAARRVSFVLPQQPVRRRPSLPILSTARPHSTMSVSPVLPARSSSLSVAPPARPARSHSMIVAADFPSPPLSPLWRTRPPTPRRAPPSPLLLLSPTSSTSPTSSASSPISPISATSPIRSPSPVLECQELDSLAILPSGILGGEEFQADVFGYRPDSSQGYRPGSSQGYRLSSSQGCRPSSLQGYRPGSSQGYRPVSSQGYRPSSSLGYRSSSSLGHRSSSSQGYRPGSSRGSWHLPTTPVESQHRSSYQAIGIPQPSISLEDVDSGFDDDASYYSKEMTLLSPSIPQGMDETDGRPSSRLSLSYIEMDDRNRRRPSRPKKLANKNNKFKTFVIRFIAGPDAMHFIRPSTQRPVGCMSGLQNGFQALARW